MAILRPFAAIFEGHIFYNALNLFDVCVGVGSHYDERQRRPVGDIAALAGEEHPLNLRAVGKLFPDLGLNPFFYGRAVDARLPFGEPLV